MSITSIDQIDDLPVGARMADTLNETPWIKHENGWSNGVDGRGRVQSSAFILAVQAGRMSVVEPDPEPLAVTLTPERVTEALIGYVDDHGHTLTNTEKYDLYEVMENLGLEVPTEPRPVTVNVNGHTSVRPTDEQVQQLIGGGSVNADDRTYNIHWTTVVTVTKEVRAGSCPCRDVTREEVDAALSDERGAAHRLRVLDVVWFAGARRLTPQPTQERQVICPHTGTCGKMGTVRPL